MQCNPLLATYDQKYWRQLQEAVQPRSTQAKEQAESTACRAKQVDLFGQGIWGLGWLELRQQTKSFIGIRAASPAVLGQGI